MANKKITELPFINTLSGSTIQDNPLLNTVVPVVLQGTTNQITVENFSRFMNLYTATTGSAGNIFAGPQTINNNVTINGNQAVNGNVSISGRLTVNEVVAQYETASILFSTGSTKLGDQITDKHEFTGSTNITGSFIVNGANLTDFSASNSATFTNYSSSNSTLFTNTSSSINNRITAVSSSINTTLFAVSSSNSATFTNFSSSNSTVFTNYSSSNSTTFTNFSSSNSTLITNYSSSINSTLFAVSASINTNIYTISSSIDSTIKANLGATNDIVLRIQQATASLQFATASIQAYTASLKGAIDVNGTKVGLGGPASSSYGVYITTDVNDGSLGIDSSADINALYLLKNGQKRFEYSVDTTAGANITRLLPYTSNGFFEIGNPSNASNSNTDYVFISENTYGNVLIGPGLPNATANLTGATATIHKVQLRGNTFIAGDLRVTGSTTLGDNNADKVEVTGSVNVTGYVSASGINIYSNGTPEILSTNNLRLTADSSVVITTDNSGTAKVWDFDNGGTINLPGGATISTPNTVDVIVAAGSAGAAQLANFNKGNYFAINDTLATINVDAGATNKVWQFTNVGSINLPGSIIKPDGGEYSASLTLTSSFHAFTASIGSTSNDYRIELNSIEAYTASLKTAAIVSSSTQVQNYDLFALNSNLYIGTGSLQAQLNGLMGFTASLDNTYATDAQLLPILQATRSLELHSGSMIGITNELMSYTASLKGAAIVSSSTQIQNYDVFALNSNLYNGTGSIKGEIAGIEEYTASLKAAAIVSSSQQVQNYFAFALTSSNNSFFGESTFTNKVTHTNGYVVLSQVSASLNFVDDAAAAIGGVPLGGLYRNGNFIVIRIA
jgi:cytoskeletal protein CcmA (bactofilin family)